MQMIIPESFSYFQSILNTQVNEEYLPTPLFHPVISGTKWSVRQNGGYLVRALLPR